MTEPISYVTPMRPLGFKNRKIGLLVFGIIMIILGAMSGCMTLVLPFTMALSRNLPPTTMTVTTSPTGGTVMSTYVSGGPANATMLTAILPYGLITIGLIWTGIGSILARRWVRPIVLTFGTIWLTIGCLAILALVFMAPSMLRSMQARMPPTAAPMPTAALAIGVAFGGFFSLVVYVGLPLLFIWYYRSIDVFRTLEFYDPHRRWTDEIPLSVLGMSITSAICALSILATSVYLIAPLFGVMLTGAAAAAVLFILIVVFGAAAVLVYQRRMLGWHLAVWGLLISYTSLLVTMATMSPTEIGRKMGMTADQIYLINDNPMFRPAMNFGMGAITCALAMIGAFRARKHLLSPIGDDSSGSVTANTQ